LLGDGEPSKFPVLCCRKRQLNPVLLHFHHL
jgi:hypothetical protein